MSCTRLLSIPGDRDGPVEVDLNGWGLTGRRLRVKTLALPPAVGDFGLQVNDVCLVSLEGASRGGLTPKVFRRGPPCDCTKKYTCAVYLAAGQTTTYTAEVGHWDVWEREAFDVERLRVSLERGGDLGREVSFGAGNAVLLEVEVAA